jgi:hypothetical protein
MAKKEDLEPKLSEIAETENYLAWSAEEPDGETTIISNLEKLRYIFQREWTNCWLW